MPSFASSAVAKLNMGEIELGTEEETGRDKVVVLAKMETPLTASSFHALLIA